MASKSKSTSRRKAEAPGKLRIKLKGKASKAVSEDEDSLGNDSDEEMEVENGVPQDLPEGTVVVEPQAVEDTPGKKKKEVPVRIDTSSLDNVACTACGTQLNPYKNGAFQKHPELKVIICRRCEKFLNSGEISKDKDGSDEQCRWCGQGGRLVVCDECSKAFCKSCILRNFNRSEFNNINSLKSWQCYLCDKSQLQSLRENYRNVRDTLKALQARDKAKAAAAATAGGNTTNGKDSPLPEKEAEKAASKQKQAEKGKAAEKPSVKEKQTVDKRKAEQTEKDKRPAGKKTEEPKSKVNGKEAKGDKKKEEEDETDKEIDKLAKLPTLRKRKAKEMNNSGDDDGDDDLEDNNEKNDKKASGKTSAAAEKKYKPGPKSSKAGKRKNSFDDLSSDDDNDKPVSDDEEDEENDELEPSVTFFIEPDGEKGQSEDETAQAKNNLAKDSDNDESDQEEAKEKKEDTSSNDDSSDGSSKKKTKAASSKAKQGKAKKKEDKEKKENGEDEDEAGDSDEKKKKKQIHSKLLDAKLSDSDDSDVVAPKKKKKEKADDSSSGSSIDSDSLEEEDKSEDSSDDNEDDDDGPKKKKKGKKKGGKQKKKGKGKKGSDDDEEEDEDDSDEDGNKKKGKGKRRKRIKKMDDSSDEDGEKNDDDDDDKNKSGKRKQIRKVMSNKKLEDSTKAAAKAEEKRRKRIAAKQREFNIETITDENNPMDCPITTKLVLEPGKEEGDPPIVQVNLKLVRKLKPHQVDAVQFMWDCMYESVKRSKKEEGAGCILAHCMGLGKTLSVISFVHTILSHKEVLKHKTCLVVSPLNTVLNWQNEWGIWLDEEDQPDVWELASCKQNPARAETLKEWQEGGGVMIIGYEMYRNLSQGARCKNKRQKKIFHEALVNPGPDLVICDEGHILKNENSSISKAMNQMRTRRRVVLTGTPLQNNLNEYHCMVSFVKPNLLGTRREFTNRFIAPIQNGQCTDSTQRDVKIMKARAHVLHEMLAGCVQRRDYSALTKFLPPKQEYVISVRLAPIQMELYEKYLELSGQGVDGVYNNKGARLFSDYQNLMKIWTHPWVLKLAEIRDELKMKYDDEDSFIDDESEAERSFSSSDSSSNEDEKMSNSDGEGPSRGPNMKKGTRRTRAKARRQAGEESDPEEVIAEWKSKTRNGKGDDEDDLPKEGDGPKMITKEWWAAYVTEDDQHKLELGNKLFLLFEILKMCEEIGDKVLIFSQSILSLNIIENFLETIDSKFQQECDDLPEDQDKDEKETFGRSWTKNLDYYRMDGSTSAQNRQLWASNFNDIDNYRTRLFLISTKAGGLGINLVAANRVIIFDASWNPSHDVQSIFRVYRFGQTKPCYIYRFLAQGTMEEKIYERQVTKLSLSQRVVDEHQIERHFSANDLKELYNFRPDRWDDGTEKPTLALPKDPLLAEILTNNKQCIVSFHEHDSLLENQIEQTLTEEEKKAAWEEYENEKKGIIIRGPGMERTASWPMMAAAQILSREQITATVHALRQQLPDISEDLFHLHVQQALRRQVQMKQEEMRRMELMRQQEITYMNMIRYQAQQSGLSYEEVQAQMEPWIQAQRMRTMQSFMQSGSSGMHHSASMSMMQNMGAMRQGSANTQPISNKPEEAINLDDN